MAYLRRRLRGAWAALGDGGNWLTEAGDNWLTEDGGIWLTE